MFRLVVGVRGAEPGGGLRRADRLEADAHQVDPDRRVPPRGPGPQTLLATETRFGTVARR